MIQLEVNVLRFGAAYDKDYNTWGKISDVVSQNMTPEMKQGWLDKGYEGLYHLVPPHFGMNRMYRDVDGDVTFEFTPEQWTWFVLRWT